MLRYDEGGNVPDATDPRLEVWTWIDGGRSMPRRLGEAPVSTTWLDVRQSRIAATVTVARQEAVDSEKRRLSPARLGYHQYAPGTGTRPPLEVGTNLRRNSRPRSLHGHWH